MSTWRIVFCLYLICATGSAAWSVHRYRHYDSAWAWDLAHLHQTFWCTRFGIDALDIRPANHYAREGPEPWRSVHLSLSRWVIFPVYCLAPRVETLLVAHALVVWLSLFAVLALSGGKGESDSSSRRGLVTVGLWTLTPIPWMMALNDCRPLQLGLPFFLWAIAGYTYRRPWMFLLGCGGALTARQEYALAVLTLAVIGRDGVVLRHRRDWVWPCAAIAIGGLWFGFYLVYLASLFGPDAVTNYFVAEHPDPAASWSMAVGRFSMVVATLLWLSGIWGIAALRQPRFWLASFPFLVVLTQQNLPGFLPGDEQWHFIRYAAIPLAFWTAGGVIALRGAGQGQIWSTGWHWLCQCKSRLSRIPSPAKIPTLRFAWALIVGLALINLALTFGLMVRLHRGSRPMPESDRRQIEQWRRQLAPRMPSAPPVEIWCDYRHSAVLSDLPTVRSYRDGFSPAVQSYWVIAEIPSGATPRQVAEFWGQFGCLEFSRGSRTMIFYHR